MCLTLNENSNRLQFSQYKKVTKNHHYSLKIPVKHLSLDLKISVKWEKEEVQVQVVEARYTNYCENM